MWRDTFQTRVKRPGLTSLTGKQEEMGGHVMIPRDHYDCLTHIHRVVDAIMKRPDLRPQFLAMAKTARPDLEIEGQ